MDGQNRVIVIGGGAAGMMAALFAARAGAQVTLLEKMKSWAKRCTSPARAGAM